MPSARRTNTIIACITLACAWTPCPVQAAAMGSPASVLKKGRWAFGLSSSVTPTRDLSDNSTAMMYQIGHVRGYGVTDWLSLYGTIGGASLTVDDPSIKKANDPSTSNSFGANVLVALQAKGKLFENKAKTWEWDGGLQYVDIRARHKNKNEARWSEWQLATSVAKSFGCFKPYLGVSYDLLAVKFRVRENGALLKQSRYENNTPVGAFLGTDVYLGSSEDVVLNVESIYLNGAEISVALSYNF